MTSFVWLEQKKHTKAVVDDEFKRESFGGYPVSANEQLGGVVCVGTWEIGRNSHEKITNV